MFIIFSEKQLYVPSLRHELTHPFDPSGDSSYRILRVDLRNLGDFLAAVVGELRPKSVEFCVLKDKPMCAGPHSVVAEAFSRNF